MKIEMNDKLKVYIEYLYDCNKSQALDYCFTKYYEYENNDIELANYFFKMIGEIIIGSYSKPSTKIPSIKVTDLEKKMIIDAAYEFVYANNPGLSGPLKNTFGELLDETIEVPFIVPYMQLIKIMQHNKEKSSKIAN